MYLLSVRYILLETAYRCILFFNQSLQNFSLKKKKRKIDAVHYISCWVTYLSHLFINTG